MPAVFTFWQTRQDESALWEYLQSTGEIIGWPDTSLEKSRTGKFPLALADLLQLKNEPSICVTRKDLLMAREPMPIILNGKRLLRMIAPEEDNAIVIQRPTWNTRTLRRTNLVAYWTPFTVEAHPVPKSKEFVAWGKKVFRWVRSRATCEYELNNYNYPATPAAKAAFESGKLTPGL